MNFSNQYCTLNNSDNTTALTFSADRLYSLRPDGNRLSPWGTNHLLLYLKILQDIQIGKLKIDQLVIFTKESEAELKSVRSTLGKEGEPRLLIDVLNQAISFNAPDCIRALCQVYGGEDKTRRILEDFGADIFVSRKSQLSLVGRLVKGQRSNIFDYYKIGLEFLKLNRYLFSYIKNRAHVIGKKIYTPQSLLDLKGDAVASIFWGTNQNDCLIFHDYNNELVCTLVINGYSYNHTVENGYKSYQKIINNNIEITLKSPIINVLADTYFGEYYTEKRKYKGIDDALQKYGYHYSFDKIAQKILNNDFNIINYEGVLIRPQEECFNKHKVYYLGGDKEKTINELKNRSINLAVLGNNHAKDYGEEALAYTLDSFLQNNIHTVGAGKNLQNSLEPIVLNYKDKKIAIFAGYWYRKHRDLDFDFYSSKRGGVTSLEGALLDSMRQFKNDNPNVFIVVFAHWGVDFKDILVGQRQLAKQLIKNGADLIFGSGPHKIQPIEEIEGRKVFYSLGNGIFNSDGWQLKKGGHLLYSYFLKWDLERESVKVYPFWNYNIENFWQPYFIEKNQHKSVDEEILQFDKEVCRNGSNVDDDGHLYYDVSVAKNITEFKSNNLNSSWYDWLNSNLQGRFLNENLLPSCGFNLITTNVATINRMERGSAVYISLSPEDLTSMYNYRGRQPQHTNVNLMNGSLNGSIDTKVSLIITDTPIEDYRNKIPQYIVHNGLLAAATLADFIMENYSGKLVTITGSAGKSSTRVLLEHLLSKQQVVSNIWNANLHLPNLDLALRCASNPDFAIVECALGGLNHFGYGNETYRFRSDIVVMTSYGHAHSVGGIERNLKLKLDIFRHTKNGATAVINGDIEEQYLWKILKQAKSQNLKIKTYSLSDINSYCYVLKREVFKDYTSVTIVLNDEKYNFDVFTNSPGYIQNILADLIVLDALGLNINDYIPLLKNGLNLPRNLESKVVEKDGYKFTLIDDTHMNSVLAMENGIKTFIENKVFYSGSTILVLEAIVEISDSENEHYKLKDLIDSSNADQVFLCGEAFRRIAEELDNVQLFLDKKDIATKVEQYLREDSFVFVKGTSASQFYTVVEDIQKLNK